MKFLITGGGFMARAFRREHPNLDVTILSRTKHDGKWIKGDVVSFAFPDEQFTHVIHAPLFLPPFCKHESEGFLRVQEYARLCNAKLMYVSSGAAANPADEYGEFKAKTEEHARDDYIIRPYAFVGPDLPLRAHYAVMNFIADGMAGREILVKGDGSNVRSWKWQGDLAREILSVFEIGQTGKPYDIGSFETHTIKECAHMVADVTNTSVRIAGERYGTPSYVPNYLKMIHGGVPWTPLIEAIRKTIKCLNADARESTKT